MNTVHWVTTVLSAAALALSGLAYFFHAATIKGFAELGFPSFFRIELGVLQVVAAVVLLLPFVPYPVKQWAYAGAALFYVTAIVAHVAHGDSHAITAVNLLLIALLFASNHTLRGS